VDPIVQSVEIAEATLAHYLASLEAVKSRGNLALRLDQEASIGAAEQCYPEIWSSLDRARQLAASTGRDLSYYDAIRSYVGIDAGRGITQRKTTVSALAVGLVPVVAGATASATGNDEGVRAARDAIAVFRTAFPELPWHQSAEPVPELRTGQGPAKIIALVAGTACAAVFVAFYIGLL
jgi:hypothetical protein